MPIPGAPVSSGTPAAVGNTVNVGNLAIAVLQLEDDAGGGAPALHGVAV